MRKLILSICRIDRKCIDYEGEWDGTWDENYEYIIYDEEGIEIPFNYLNVNVIKN